MTALQLQESFFKNLKTGLPEHIALVDLVADELNISNDSAYRRMRGEKMLTLDEIQKLSLRFNCSLDTFLQLKNGGFVFRGSLVSRDNFNFESYLQGIVNQLTFFCSAEKKEMYYLNKDIPIFHHFMFPELAAFKCYFWCRYNLNNPQFNKGQFLIDDFIDMFNKAGKKISDLYLQIPSTEIWNLDCINTTIRQIDYYRESRVFKSKEDINIIYDCLEKLVDHIEQQVEHGSKFPYGKKAESKGVKYSVLVNEFILGDNTFIVDLDGKKMVFLNHNVINYILTTNEDFVEYSYQTLQVLLKKSTLISEVGEKERQLFFDNLRDRVHQKRKLMH